MDHLFAAVTTRRSLPRFALARSMSGMRDGGDCGARERGGAQSSPRGAASAFAFHWRTHRSVRPRTSASFWAACPTR